MSDESGVQPTQDRSGTTMYRPSAEGGLEPVADHGGDYRDQLLSDRWNAAPLENPEVEKTDPRLAALAIAILGAITLLVIVIGYGSGFWG